MPAIVDHEARRRHIAAIAADLIATGGLEAATVRRVAAAAGCSTAVVTHYFAEKRELLVRAYSAVAQRAQDRFDAACERDPKDLLGALKAFMPDDDAGMRAWRVFFSFWSATSSDPALAAEQRWWLKNAQVIIEAAIERAYGPSPDTEEHARMLLTAIQGVAVQAVFDQDFWTAEEQHHYLAMQIGLVLGGGGQPAMAMSRTGSVPSKPRAASRTKS